MRDFLLGFLDPKLIILTLMFSGIIGIGIVVLKQTNPHSKNNRSR